MIIFPAIDIKDGKVVRLLQGRFEDVTEYSTDPVKIAQQWVEKGAQWLHVVDLDGAKTGELKNFDVIAKIAQSVDIPIQIGGGIRTKDDIKRLLDANIKRAILGTKIIENREFLKDILNQWADNIIVSLDCSDGMVAQRGWTSITDLKATDLAKELEEMGLKYLVYTDIKRDGMLTGPDFEGLETLLNTVNISVIASGGISDINDIKRLCAFESKGLIGAITGKALYEGKLDLESALKVCSQNA